LGPIASVGALSRVNGPRRTEQHDADPSARGRALAGAAAEFVSERLADGRRAAHVLDSVDAACSGFTALHFCCGAESVRAAQMLLEADASDPPGVASDGSQGATPGVGVGVARDAGDARAAAREPRARDVRAEGFAAARFGPLHVAARRGATELIELLLSHGALVDGRDVWGHTPLHYAAAHGHAPAVRLLLERGARAAAVTDAGHTPLDFSLVQGGAGCAEAHELLRAHRDEQSGFSGARGVRGWLGRIGLGQYADAFVALGYDDLAAIREHGLGADDLDALGVRKMGHRKKLRILHRLGEAPSAGAGEGEGGDELEREGGGEDEDEAEEEEEEEEDDDDDDEGSDEDDDEGSDEDDDEDEGSEDEEESDEEESDEDD
jgi:hypothetical protein